MAKVLAVLDVNASYFTVRMDDGQTVFVQHPHVPHVGEELPGEAKAGLTVRAPSLRQLNSTAQFQANILSEIVQPHSDDEPLPTDPAREEESRFTDDNDREQFEALAKRKKSNGSK